MPQFFNENDLKEKKFYDSANPLISDLGLGIDELFDNCFECFILGDIIYDAKAAPLTNAIEKDIFRSSFFSIFDSFLFSGSFESYLDVFEKIFGPEATVEFVVPAPGKLNINISATGLDTFGFGLKTISSNMFVFDTLTDDLGNRIIFQSFKGFESQFELEKLLFEMVPAGIFTTITLEIGE